MKKQDITERTLDKRVSGKTDWEKVKNMTEEEIHQAALSDPNAQPTDEAFWNDAEIVVPVVMDEDVFKYVKKEGKGNEAHIINTAIRAYMTEHPHPK